jgi:outer membrane protein OmpA-like peptidoglycan-associated protein
MGTKPGEGTAMTEGTHASEASGSGRRKVDGVKPFVILLGVLATFVGGALGGSWLHLKLMEASATSPATSPSPAVVPATPVPGPVDVKTRTAFDAEAIHTDVYFDFKSTRLRADSVRLLQEEAAVVARSGDWVVLVQGYADRQGPVEYNRRLAQRRAEEVKRFLVELGLTDSAIKVVTIGPDGALCDDPGPECQRLNRRVHLEMRRISRISAATQRPALVDGDTLSVTPATSGSSAATPARTMPTPASQDGE